MKQRTISHKVSVSGPGIFNSKLTTTTFKPCSVKGIFICRKDKKESPLVKVCFNNVSNLTRSIDIGGIQVTEHLLAVVAALRISNLIIEIDNYCLPIFNNTCLPYFEALQPVLKNLSVPIPSYTIDTEFCHKNSFRKIGITPFESSSLAVNYEIDFESAAIGVQKAQYGFRQEEFKSVCTARSFGPYWHRFFARLIWLRHAITEQNILLYTKKRFMNRAPYAVQLNGKEPVWHKLLDFLGALAVLESDIGGMLFGMNFSILKSGHRFDIETLKALRNILLRKA